MLKENENARMLTDDDLDNVNGGSGEFTVFNDPKGAAGGLTASSKIGGMGGLKGSSVMPGQQRCDMCGNTYEKNELSLRNGKYYCNSCLKKLNAKA